MAIQIWNGSSWVTSEDPEVFSGGLWTNVQKGEVYTSTGWQVFYLRISPVAPTITLGSRTSSSITVNVSVPTGSPYKTQVTIWRVAGVETNIPSSPAVGEISSTYTQSGLSAGTSYTFSAYTKYYDPTTNELVAQSSTTTFTTSTLSVTITAPTIVEVANSATVSSLTVTVALANKSPYRTQVTIYRVGNASNPGVFPASPAVGAISENFTQSNLAVNTSYTFEAYADYYDGATYVATSSTTSLTLSTLNYIITTPTKPVLDTRGFTSLKFAATSNANYSRNGVSASVTFWLEELVGLGYEFVTTVTVNLSQSSSSQTVTATFSNLTSKNYYRCRARTVYSSPVNQQSDWSSYSDLTQTNYYDDVNTNLIASNNTTYLDNGLVVVPSQYSSAWAGSRASDGNDVTEWLSALGTSTTLESSSPGSRTVNYVLRGSSYAEYVPTSSFLGKPTRATVTGLSYYNVGSDTNTSGSYYDLKYWTFDFGATKFTWFYKTTVTGRPVASIGDTIRVYNVSAALGGTTYKQWIVDGRVNNVVVGGVNHEVMTVITPGAGNAGSQSNPITDSDGYIRGMTFNGGTAVTTLNVTTYTSARSDSTTSILRINDSRGSFSRMDTPGGTISYYYSVGVVAPNDLTIYVSFDPNKLNPRMTTANKLRVKNGNQARSISAKINNTNLGSKSFTAGQAQEYSLSTQINTAYDAYLNAQGFLVELTVPQVYDANAGGYVGSIVEVQISYTYDSPAY